MNRIPSFSKIQEAVDTPFDNSSNGFVSDNVQSAIEEVRQIVPIAGSNVLFGFDGTACSGRWLEVLTNVASSVTPIVIAGSRILRHLSVSAAAKATATITVFRNGSSFASISLSNVKSAVTLNLNLDLANGDALSARVTSGSASKPVLIVWF